MPGIEDEDDDDDVEGLAGKLYRKSVMVTLNENLINQRFLKLDKILVNQKNSKLIFFNESKISKILMTANSGAMEG